jgi:hypothetical protein
MWLPKTNGLVSHLTHEEPQKCFNVTRLLQPPLDFYTKGTGFEVVERPSGELGVRPFIEKIPIFS